MQVWGISLLWSLFNPRGYFHLLYTVYAFDQLHSECFLPRMVRCRCNPMPLKRHRHNQSLHMASALFKTHQLHHYIRSTYCLNFEFHSSSIIPPDPPTSLITILPLSISRWDLMTQSDASLNSATPSASCVPRSPYQTPTDTHTHLLSQHPRNHLCQHLCSPADTHTHTQSHVMNEIRARSLLLLKQNVSCRGVGGIKGRKF